ncbi:MAG: trypsin-like peptidase domain-containing protein [Bacteroidetes bacterium]|nr:trypsin-like peptidase domain-containing protein [Bacteroidota bacterium]
MSRLFHTLAAILLVACSSMASAQITYGGSPWTSGERSAPLLLPALDRAALAAEDRVTDRYKEAPWRFGVEHDVLWDANEHGTWTIENGHAVWRLVVRAEGATNLSVRFRQFDVPKGGELFLYSADGESVMGALDHRNMKDWGGLATGVLATDELVVEYRQPLDLTSAPSLVIDQVVQGYRALSGWPHGGDRGPFGNSGQCNINVNCPEGAPWATEKRSVALIVNGGLAQCSGALINNTLNDGTPYFLTANHCLGNPGTWVYYFNHESANCTGSTGPTNQSISGGTLLANSSQSDFALIELSQVPPASFNLQYAGWDASGDVPENAVGIHHPDGDVKKICFEDDSPYQTTANNAQVWWIDQWEEGVTEPASSGSPLFDQNHRIIGQLFGGAAACAGSVNNGQYDFYGRFNVSWNLGLEEYLDPAGSGVQVWDGFPDGAVSFDNDAGIAISSSPQEVLCGAQEVIIEVTLTNTGSSTLTSCMLTYQINGGAPQQQSWAGTLEQYETTVVALPAFQSQDGVNTVQVNVTTPNGVADENALNNSAIVEFTSFEGPTNNFRLTLVLDNYGNETTWTLNRLDQTLYSGGPYQQGTNGEVIVEEFCLEEVCYQFRIEDSYEDGICCDFGEGSWTLTDPNGEVVGTGGAFGAFEQILFCPDETLTNLELEASSLIAYPNPAHGEVSLVWPEANGRAIVLDVAGREVWSEAIGQTTSTWNTSAWAEGTYLVKWTGGHGTTKVTRIAVAH